MGRPIVHFEIGGTDIGETAECYRERHGACSPFGPSASGPTHPTRIERLR